MRGGGGKRLNSWSVYHTAETPKLSYLRTGKVCASSRVGRLLRGNLYTHTLRALLVLEAAPSLPGATAAGCDSSFTPCCMGLGPTDATTRTSLACSVRTASVSPRVHSRERGQTPSTGLRHPALLRGRCRKAVLGVWRGGK